MAKRDHDRSTTGSTVPPPPKADQDVQRESGRMPKVARRRHAFPAPSPESVLREVLELSSQATPELDAEVLVRRYLDAFGRLFPERRIAIRLVSLATGETTVSVGAPAAPSPGLRSSIGRDALARQSLGDHAVAASGIAISDGYTAIFEPGARGFEAPLLDGKNVTGVISVEYGPSDDAIHEDLSVVVPLALDLSTKLRTGRLLRESRYLRDYLSKLLEHANAPIIVIGRKRDIRVVNRAFLALTGMERELLLARDFFDLLPVEETTRLLPVFVNALRGEPTSSFEVRIPRAAGGNARLLVNTASILDADGEVEAVIAIGRDLTELRELEAQVIHAEKLATLGQLAASVVHELNNPLTSISAYADYLAHRHAADPDRAELEKIERIRESVGRILEFTRNLVTYARPSGEAPRLVAVASVVRQAVAFCDHVVTAANARVTTLFAPDLPQVYAVPSHLHQVFINLITNASQAMSGRGGTIHVEALRDPEGNVEIRVTDEGVGIEQEKLARIFEPFFSTKREGEGTGLGLSIVKNIVDQHRGKIRVTSAVGEGSVFVVTLPAAEVP